MSTLHEAHSTPADTARPGRGLDGELAFYHANAKGTGTALRFDLKPGGRRRKGCFYMEMAHQKDRPDTRAANRRAATFDWENKATVKLGFADLCEFLLVLEGAQESLGNDARGLYHTNGGTNTMIALRRREERPGFALGVSRQGADGAQQFKGRFVLSAAEARGLRAVLENGLLYVALGSPDTGGDQ